MKLALSLLSLRPGQVGGAETYVRQLLVHLPREAAPGDRLVAVMDRDVAAQLATPGWERIVLPRSSRRIVADRILEAFTPWRARGVEGALRAIDADVTLFPQQSIFPKRAPGRAVLTVVDVQHLELPGVIPAFERAFRPAIYPYSMARADHLVAISEFTRRTVIDRCGVAPGKVTAIPLGYEPRDASAVTPTDRVAGPYLYFPAASFAHKNHAALIRSYAALRRRGDLAAKLVFTGMQTPAWKRLARLARDLGVEADVVHLGFLPYPEARRVYAGADAVVFPSRYEGFGLPVLEAAVEFRKKVITSRLPVFEELGVPPERQIDFEDPEALLAALRLAGPTVLARAPSTWEDCARHTMGVLRAVAAGDARSGGAARAGVYERSHGRPPSEHVVGPRRPEGERPSMKRLAIVEYLMSAGGVERVLRGLARAFLEIPEARGWDITFLLSRYTSARQLAEWPGELTGPNLRVEWLGEGTAPGRALNPLAHLQGVGGIRATRVPLWAAATAARRLGPAAWRTWLGDPAALISQASRRFDLLYFPYPFQMPAPPMAAPVVATPQDFNFKFFLPEGSIRRRIEERATRSWLRRADRVLLTSHAVEAELGRFYPEHAAKTRVVHLGIDLDRPAPAPEAIEKVRRERDLPPRFALVTGWVVPHKNQRLVVEAGARLRARGTPLPLVFVGPNSGHLGPGPAPGFRTPYVEEVQGALRDAGLRHGEDFLALGYVSDAEVQALLRLATVFVCASTYEGFGLPGLEAMRARCPVLLSAIPPFEEQNRLLGGGIRTFDPRSAESLAEALASTLARPAETAATAALLADRVGDVYDWRRTARAYLAQFDELLAARSAGQVTTR